MLSTTARAALTVPLNFLLMTMIAGADEVSEFAELGILVEQNATDGDTEIVITAVPDTDQGLKRFAVRAPDKRRILAVHTPARVMRLREFLFETPEPEGEQILAVYPEGRYRFWGIAEDGERFFGTARLSHRLPHPAMIIHPASGQEVPADSLTIQWSQVPGIEQFLLDSRTRAPIPSNRS